MSLKKNILSAIFILLCVWTGAWVIRNYPYYHHIKKGEKSYRVSISTKDFHNKWLIINWGFFFGGGDLNQECRYMVIRDKEIIYDKISEERIYDIDTEPRFFFPMIQTPVTESDSITFIIKPSEGAFKSNFWFRFYFLDNYIQ